MDNAESQRSVERVAPVILFQKQADAHPSGAVENGIMDQSDSGLVLDGDGQKKKKEKTEPLHQRSDSSRF